MMMRANIQQACRRLRCAVVAACFICCVSEWTASAAPTLLAEHLPTGVATSDQQPQLQPQNLDNLFLQICSQQEMSSERVIQGVATALGLPIRLITVLDVTEVDSIADALKLAQRRQRTRRDARFVSWPWNVPDNGRQVRGAMRHASYPPRKVLQPAGRLDLSTSQVPWQALELCLHTPDAQALQAQLARAAGNGSLVAALEAASAFVPKQSLGPTGLMVTLRTRSMDDLAAFALGQTERQGADGGVAAFLVDSIQTQPAAGSIRMFLAGAFLASIGVGFVVYSILGVCLRYENDDGPQFMESSHKSPRLPAATTPQPADRGITRSFTPRISLVSRWQARPWHNGTFVVKPRRKLVRLLKANVCRR